MFNLIVLSRVIILISVLFQTQSAFAAANNFRVTQPSNNIQQVSRYQNASGMRELSRMEKQIFGRNFSNETQNERVSRLEREMFGMNQSGDINTRFDNLRAGYRGYNNTQCPQYKSYYNQPHYNNQYPYYNNQPIIRTGGGVKGMLNSLGNFMIGGTPTGFSPQINPSYADWYNNDPYTGSSGYSKGFTSNRGYGYYNQNTGGSTGVTILD